MGITYQLASCESKGSFSITKSSMLKCSRFVWEKVMGEKYTGLPAEQRASVPNEHIVYVMPSAQ